MKKLFFLIVLGVLSLTAGAQTRFGYFSYEEVLKSMPDYVLAQRSIDDLRVKYDAELKRAEEEFNSKYEEFLEVQKDLVPAILRKRQAEPGDDAEEHQLQERVEASVAASRN